METLYLPVLALLLGGAVGALWANSRARAAHEAALQEKAALAASLDAERRSGAEKLAVLQDAESKLRDAFSALSSEALKRNTESFLQLARTSLGEFQKNATMDLEVRQKAIDLLVQPLRESLKNVDTKLNEVERGRASSQAQLSEQLRSLSQSQQVLHSETTKLARALRSPNTRGQWGEIQLRRILESAGLLEAIHFDFKESTQTEEGRLSPDVIIKLPGGKNVVVDAKVPLAAYLDAMEGDDEHLRVAKLKDHARQLKEHVNRLASKNYWAHFQPAPDIVVMFVPGEALLSSAMQHDPALLEFSMGKGIMLASPLSLDCAAESDRLRMAAGHRREERSGDQRSRPQSLRPHREARRALRERRPQPGESSSGLQRRVGTLESRVLVTARRLKDKGVTASEEFRELETDRPDAAASRRRRNWWDCSTIAPEVVVEVAENGPAISRGALRSI